MCRGRSVTGGHISRTTGIQGVSLNQTFWKRATREKKEKLTCSNYLFLCFNPILANECFFMAAILALDLALFLAELLFLAGHDSVADPITFIGFR